MLTHGPRGPVCFVLLQHPAQPQVGKLGHHATLSTLIAGHQHVARVLPHVEEQQQQQQRVLAVSQSPASAKQ
jgi:hypothetical protein